MIEFKRRRLPVWVCKCDDIPNYYIDPPILNFDDIDDLSIWLKNTLDIDDSDIVITDRSVLTLGGVCGWFEKKED